MAEDVQGTPATPGGSGGASAFSTGQRVGAGRYTLLRQLGQGGMGMVWLAQDEQLGEEVALKFLAREISHDADSLEELRRETLKSRKLTHSHIIRIHDLHQAPGEAPFISMEYVNGQTLSALKAQQPSRLFAWDFLQPLVRQLCDALEYAHRHKVIHRDLKPANMMVNSDGELRLADFGIAAVASESMSRLSQQRNTSGTPAYMSPQQMNGRPPRITDDIYALGATLYELLTSKPPFYHGSIPHQVMNVPADPLDARLAELELSNAIPPNVAALIMACLAKDPAQRPQSVEAVAEWIGLTLSTVPAGQLLADAAGGAESAPAGRGAGTEENAEQEVVELPVRSRWSAKAGWWIGAVAMGILLVGLCFWALGKKRGGSAVALLGKVYTNAVGAEMVYIPPGEFMLGSTKEEQAWALAAKLKEEVVKLEGKAPRKARIKQGFLMGRTEVTVGQWRQFVAMTGYITEGERKGESMVPQGGDRWGPFKGASWKTPNFGFTPTEQHPVSCIAWNDAMAFCEWLTTQERKARRPPTGWVVRLPTEAEWEYACRAGTQMKFWWGEVEQDGKGRLNWSKNDRFEFAAPVDSFGGQGRNGFGLADMLGNVYEWCLDEYDATQAHEDLWRGNPNARVLRGGSFQHAPCNCRCASRHSRSPDSAVADYGFRVVLGVDVASLRPSTRSSSSVPTGNQTPTVEPWQDWMAEQRKSGRIPGEFKEDGAAWVRPKSGVTVLRESIRDGAVRVTFKLSPETPACVGLDLRGVGGAGYQGYVSRTFVAVLQLDKDIRRRIMTNALPASANPEREMTFEFRAVGDALSCKLNGQPVATCRDSTFNRPGAVRLYCQGGDARISRIEILNLDEASLIPMASAVSRGVDEAFLRKVAALPPEQQVARVISTLKELNPAFDGKEKHGVNEGKVTYLEFSSAAITNLAPLRALTGLRVVMCRGSESESERSLVDLGPLKDLALTKLDCSRSRIVDLSPLTGMPLTALNCGYSRVRDLSAIRGMSLTNFSCGETPITDLSPLTGMPLLWLSCGGCQVADLSPLRGMKLTELYITRTRIRDLSPLQGMPLTSISCDFRPERDTAILRSLRTLKHINGVTTEEFWKQVAAGKVPKPK